MTCRIDHLVVTAPDLDQGVAWIEQALSVRMSGGGQHPRMATHNRLLRLGEACYLEVIAPDPAASPPGRPRWFGLDAAGADTPVALRTWVARSTGIAASLASATEEVGALERMNRGALEWLISITPDGSLPLGGVAPALIEWPAGVHPAQSLPDTGCRLVALELHHPQPSRVGALLASIGVAEAGVAVSVHPAPAPGLVAHLSTPSGMKTLAAV
ncbi:MULTISPECIES: VOC family protein [Ramlibacter]|uniref:VOC family protein n=1 Tax=Ramlibacter aquaticus TaxID=2780094 RepID=A0ABR9SFD5_9BURK|nr:MULTISPECIES: VOC family protein [Ramlibacter]MBE7941064.1 VOC family protein [Ramlibacter aquaticus]